MHAHLLRPRCLEATARAWESLAHCPDLEGLERPQRLTLLFRFDSGNLPSEAVDGVNGRILHDLVPSTGSGNSGHAVIEGTTVQGRPWLKLTIVNPDTTDTELTELFELIAAAGRGLVARAMAGPYA